MTPLTANHPCRSCGGLRRAFFVLALLWVAVGAAQAAQAAQADQAEQAVDRPVDYRVEPGDTLIGLRGRVIKPGADWRLVQRLNRIDNPRRLRPGSTLRIPASMLLAQPEQAEVLYVQGQVTVQQGGQPPQPLTSGGSVGAGDRLVSAAQSSAVLRLADGSRLLLRPNSALVLEQLVRLGTSGRRDTRLRLDSGAADAEVPPSPPQAPARHRLELRTPMVNLAVRGTDFRASADALTSRLEVLEGRVAAGSTVVPHGFGVVATPAGVSMPLPLPPPPLLDGMPTLLERLPLELAWAPQAGAAAYRVQLIEAGPAGRLMLDGRFSEPRALARRLARRTLRSARAGR